MVNQSTLENGSIMNSGLMCALLFVVSAAVLAQPVAGRFPDQKPPDRYVLIHAGILLAVPGARPQTGMTVVVVSLPSRAATSPQSRVQRPDPCR